MSNKKAFSFIEILVVVTIMGIISIIGLVKYTEFLKQSRDAKRRGDLEQIRAALEMYKSKNDVYPTTLTFGGDLCDPVGGCPSGTYIKKIPQDTKTGYTYYYSSDGNTYAIGALLEQVSSSSCGNCKTSPNNQLCNYCMGPYGQL